MNTSPSQNTVFLITHEFFPKRGGIATFTGEMARASAALGLNVEVWAQNAPPENDAEWPFPIWRMPLKGTHDLTCQLRLAVQLIRRRRELRNATVYLPEPGPMLTLMLLQRFNTFRPKHLVLTFHGSEVLKFHRNPLIRPLARRLIRYAKRISVLSGYTRDLLLTHFPEARSKILLTPGALRSDFAVVPSSSNGEKSKIIVLTVGRLHPRKGQLITLDALRALAPKFRGLIEYWMVGSTAKEHYEHTLRAAAATCDFPVRFFGDIPDDELSGIYERADIFGMTSVDYGNSVEGFGLVYLEAAAHGLPVVAHSVGGVAEAVADGKTGLLVPPHHPAQLTAAFEKLISDEVLRQRLGSSGRDWARRNNWSHSAKLLFNEELESA
ncbi:glycosyltransferase family 4 protein [Synoicihabitans lomoniglobus]|uniref:Glycosyltransferase family 4 protein n=1 Tax=Synoicihabitans lomoniglobus TaxID=2909285 RepID=A0AAF0I687_9BACT|nr:glycosyltransferase family 4 protein [Opitutaceae bacterium LMO-M01]WED67425.1 glycosyltransferase family 4 protein [Opitutaceae bacterium LMO-M01]